MWLAYQTIEYHLALLFVNPFYKHIVHFLLYTNLHKMSKINACYNVLELYHVQNIRYMRFYILSLQLFRDFGHIFADSIVEGFSKFLLSKLL